MLGRVFVELQEHIGVVDDLGDRFGILGAVVETSNALIATCALSMSAAL
ncbi:transposase, mutator type domain protein [Mycobacterium avium MAV_061107_1842]|nr:transposase, mutator type domain protein [Mycobacterium avium MAV_061107_1842]